MSKVYSFRLSHENPREAQAREVIEAWVGEGYSLRHVVVEALILFSQKRDGLGNLETLMEYLESQFSRISLVHIESSSNSEKSKLSAPFITAVKNSAKLGFTSD